MATGQGYKEVKSLLRELSLHTVCEEAGCPNIYECFASRTATFLILGDQCTRNCRFCRVQPGSPGGKIYPGEAENVAEAARRLGLHHVVVTSVTRDDLPDGGAAVFADTIKAVRAASPGCTLEVLVPDFRGDEWAIFQVVGAKPEVLNHNVETVPRLYAQVRPQADYARSLQVISRAHQMSPGLLTKSGLMVGMGEERSEVLQVASDLRDRDCEIITIGQYLQPSREHLPVARFWAPEEFEELERDLSALGFSHVEAGPLVRSSYHAFTPQRLTAKPSTHR